MSMANGLYFLQVPGVPIETMMKTAISNSGGVLISAKRPAGARARASRASAHGLRHISPEVMDHPAEIEVIEIDQDEKKEEVANHGLAIGGQNRFLWTLSGAITIPGQKHVFDNLSSDLTKQMFHFKTFQSDLSVVNHLMHQKFYRDRLKTLMTGTPYARLFDSHKPGSLAMWRWGSLVEVCQAFHSLEGALRKHWNLQRFLNVRGKDSENIQPSDTFAQCDRAIRSNFFWSYLKFVLLIHGVINDLSSWTEGCACHGHSLPSCPLKGRRSPELASGLFDSFLADTFSTASSLFTAIASGVGEGSREWEILCSDWNIACDVAVAELHIKTSFWKQLPWALCGMGMPDQEAGRAAARKAVALYSAKTEDAMATLARRHPLVQRFLKPSGELLLGCKMF